MRADLHAHSTASDGTLAPGALVRLACERGLDVLALTDHDSVEGVGAAVSAAQDTHLTLVAGVELSAVWQDRDVHVLGYFVDYRDAALLAHLDDLRLARLRRAESIVDHLRKAGYEIELDDVLALAEGGSVGRSHVARALVDGGHVDSVPEAFANLLGRGRPFYVPKDVRSPLEVVDMIHDAGGIAVLAHPGVTRVDALIPTLMTAGLDGIEAYHAEHAPEEREHYARFAEEHGLLVTGGSDFHGLEAPSADLGGVDVPAAAVERLLAFAR